MFFYDRRKVARQMGKDYLQVGLVGQWLAILFIAFGGYEPSPIYDLGCLLLILGTGVLVGGCYRFARYHGMSFWWGLAGLANIIGVSLLYFATLLRGNQRFGRGFAVIHDPPYRRDVWRMDIRVRLDPSLGIEMAELIALQAARGATAADALQMLINAVPKLSDLGMSPRFRINGDPARRRDELSNGDELTIYLSITPGSVDIEQIAAHTA